MELDQRCRRWLFWAPDRWQPRRWEYGRHRYLLGLERERHVRTVLQDFTGEGVGRSCRLAFPIRTDRYYRFRVWRLSADSLGQWWGAWIQDETTGVDTYVGMLRAPGAGRHQLMSPTMNFSEYFGPAVSCDSVPVSRALWTQPAANHLGAGVYEFGSHSSGSHRGACTGGTVSPTSIPAKATSGVWIIQGGHR